MRFSSLPIILFLLLAQAAAAAECDWDRTGAPTAESSVPDGMSGKWREIGIAQPMNEAIAAMKREFIGARVNVTTETRSVGGKCSLAVGFRASVPSREENGRTELFTAQFGSPLLGSQLLAFERHIRYTQGVLLPVVAETVAQLRERFGEPSASGPGLLQQGRVYYFAFKDKKRITLDLQGPCRVPSGDYPPRIFEFAKSCPADFVVHAYFEIWNSNHGNSLPSAVDRYTQLWVQYLDLKRARVDAEVREEGIRRLEHRLGTGPKEKLD
jgi:hypothetical protein